MHRYATTLCAALLVATLAAPAAAQVKLPRPSQKSTITQTIGLTDVTVVYSRPGVKGRAIWGSLVPYGEPWRTGANEATAFTCSQDVMIEGKMLPAGTYSMVTIPTADTWTVAFSKDKELWGSYDYKPENDALRITVKPRAVSTHEEWMSFRFADLSWTGGMMVLAWEKMEVPVRIDVDDVDQAMAAIRDTIGRAPANDWRTPYRGASFCLDADANLMEGAQWAEKSVKAEEGYYNVSLLARYHAKQGKVKEAVAIAEKAIKLGKAMKEPADTKPTERLIAEWTAKKM